MSKNRQDDGITSGDVVSYVAGNAAKTYVGTAAATTAATALGTGVMASVAVIAVPFALAGTVGWVAKSAWDSLTDWF